MQISILTRKTETFYTAIAPALALVSYGQCREEAQNNLQEDIRARRENAESGAAEERK
jgi:hypothetical protein